MGVKQFEGGTVFTGKDVLWFQLCAAKLCASLDLQGLRPTGRWGIRRSWTILSKRVGVPYPRGKRQKAAVLKAVEQKFFNEGVNP